MAGGLENEKLIHLFTTPILKHVWADSEDLNEELRHIIINKTRGGKGTTYSAVGGWESGDDFYQWSGDLGQTIVQWVAEMVKQATSELYATFSGRELGTWTIAMWANVNRLGNYNRIHVHPGSTWTGSHVVDTDHKEKHETLSGVIGLINPNLAQAMSLLPQRGSNPLHRAAGAGTDDDLAELRCADGASAHRQTPVGEHFLQREEGSLSLTDTAAHALTQIGQGFNLEPGFDR